MLLEIDVLKREYISQGSPEKQDTHTHTHTHTHSLSLSLTHTHTGRRRRRYFKEFVHVIVDTGKTEICRACRQAGNSGESFCYRLKLIDWKLMQVFYVKDLRQNCFFEKSQSLPLRSLTD